MVQAFLENRVNRVVGAVGGGCGVAYLRVCTWSSLSPLGLCAAFVYAEEVHKSTARKVEQGNQQSPKSLNAGRKPERRGEKKR